MSPPRRSRGNPGGINPNNAHRGDTSNYVLASEKVTNEAKRSVYLSTFPELAIPRAIMAVSRGNRREKMKGHLSVPFDNVGHIEVRSER